MKIHEYQAMELFKEYGINTARCELALNAARAAKIAGDFGSKVVVKAQVLVGGRGKAGGIKLASSSPEAEKIAEDILSMEVKSIPVKKVLVAEAVDILKEYYLSITVDRDSKRMVFIGSSSGGVDIEQLAVNSPDKIHKLYLASTDIPPRKEIQDFAVKIFEDESLAEKAVDTMLKMHRLFLEKDCSLVEINPFVKVAGGGLLAVDAKINFDDNGLFKHPGIAELRSAEEYSADESSARCAGLSFVSMDGNVGCIVNGAGLAMATMDVIKLFGGEAANFLDVGGSSNPDKVLTALRIILSNKKVKVILINIFGGITRCDDIAKGIILARDGIDIPVPLVIRLIGTNDSEGRQILKDKGLTVLEGMSEAVQKAVELAK